MESETTIWREQFDSKGEFKVSVCYLFSDRGKSAQGGHL